MDFKTAQPIIDACKKKAEEGMQGYTSGRTAILKAYADWQEEETDQSLISLCSWSLVVGPGRINQAVYPKGEKGRSAARSPEFFDMQKMPGPEQGITSWSGTAYGKWTLKTLKDRQRTRR